MIIETNMNESVVLYKLSGEARQNTDNNKDMDKTDRKSNESAGDSRQ